MTATIPFLLQPLKDRLAAATPGPWFREYGDVITTDPDPRDVEEGYDDPRSLRVVRAAPHLAKREPQAIKDATFIANAPTDQAKLIAAIEAVAGLHKPEKRWEPYEGAGYTFFTRDQALEAAGEVDLGVVAIEAGPQFFEVCGECARVESEQLSETGEEWGYREALWPCKTAEALTQALGGDTA